MATTKTSKKAKTAKICQPPTSTSTTATIDDNNNINTDNNDAVVTLSRRQKSSLGTGQAQKKQVGGVEENLTKKWKNRWKNTKQYDTNPNWSTSYTSSEKKGEITPKEKWERKKEKLRRKGEKAGKQNNYYYTYAVRINSWLIPNTELTYTRLQLDGRIRSEKRRAVPFLRFLRYRSTSGLVVN